MRNIVWIGLLMSGCLFGTSSPSIENNSENNVENNANNVNNVNNLNNLNNVNNFNNINNLNNLFDDVPMNIDVMEGGPSVGFYMARSGSTGTYIARSDIGEWQLVSDFENSTVLSMDRSGDTVFVLIQDSLWSCCLEESNDCRGDDVGESGISCSFFRDVTTGPNADFFVTDNEPTIGRIDGSEFFIDGIDSLVTPAVGANKIRALRQGSTGWFAVSGGPQTLFYNGVSFESCVASVSMKDAVPDPGGILGLDGMGKFVTPRFQPINATCNDGPPTGDEVFEKIDAAFASGAAFVALATEEQIVVERVMGMEAMFHGSIDGIAPDMFRVAANAGVVRVMWLEDEFVTYEDF